MEPYERKHNDSLAEVVWNHTTVTPQMRAQVKFQRPKCIWLTGFSGSGKSTLANALEAELNRQGFHTMLLDGDNVRHGLCKDLGMSDEDRNENIRRVAEVAKLMTEAGLLVITAFISPFREGRAQARTLFGEGQFVEVFVDASLEVCEQRDPKGLYKKAREGRIKDFTGVSSAYEVPDEPEIHVYTDTQSVEQSVEVIVERVFVENGKG